MSWGAVPILNENDTIATDELAGGKGNTFGDNDLLAAVVSAALAGDALILLTGAAGVLDSLGKPVAAFRSVEDAVPLLRTGLEAKSAAGKGGDGQQAGGGAAGDDGGRVHGRRPPAGSPTC